MSEPFQNDPSASAKKRLADASRTKDTSMRLAWAITLCEAVLLGVLAVALMDYWLMLPVWIRAIGASAVALLAAFGIYRLIRFWRRPTPLKEAALDLEKQRPELGCTVSTAAEYLSGERQTTQEYEPELVAALEAKAAEDLRTSTIHYERKLWRPSVVLFFTLLLFLVFIVAAPVALTALKRAALPFSGARYTQIAVTPGNMEIPVGQDLEITNLFSGRLPKDPLFHWQRQGDASWQSGPLTTRASNGAYLISLKKVQNDLQYFVSGNDAVSPVYQVTTYVPPRVKDLSLRVEYPAYTHLKPSEQSTPDVTAVRASTIQVQIEPSVALSQARLRLAATTNEVLLKPTPEGRWTGTVKVTKDTDYWIELADRHGHRGGEDQPHHIRALPDSPPKVEIEDPGQDSHASATNKLPVKLSVADDFGVEDVRVVFHKLGHANQVVSAKLDNGKPGESTATAELDLAPLDLKEYDLVEYYAEAKDNNTLDGPGIGKSPVYFVEITHLEGGLCKKPQPGQKLNLVEIQKQIIADTEAISTNTNLGEYQGLAARQRDAKDFGQIYLDTLTRLAAPGAAVNEMQSAIKDMGDANGFLSSQKRADALPPEEGALAHLYQVIKQMPQLEDLPTQPKPREQKLSPTNQLAVVLEAIKEKKKEPSDEQPIQDALQQAQQLALAQAAVNQAMRHRKLAGGQGQGQAQGKASPANNPTASPDQPNTKAEAKTQDQSKANDALAKADTTETKGQGQGQGQGQEGKGNGQQQQAQAKGQGEGQGQGNAKGKGQGDGNGPGDPNQTEQAQANGTEPPLPTEQLADQEQELSKEAQALADKLERLAGNDKRLGHQAGQNAKLGGQKIAQAGQEMKKGNFGSAGVNGFQGELALRKVAEELGHMLKPQPELTDAANEDAPKQYEPLISEYFKRLSHAE
jgi:hypothetical protein